MVQNPATDRNDLFKIQQHREDFLKSQQESESELWQLFWRMNEEERELAELVLG